MVLFHPFVWPLFLISLCLLVVCLTALDLPTQVRRLLRRGPVSDASAAAEIVKRPQAVHIQIVRNSGIFWFCAGGVTFVYALTAEAWSRPGSGIGLLVGLLWMVLGVRIFRSVSPRRIVWKRANRNRLSLSEVVSQLADRACASEQVGLVVGAIGGGEEFLRGFGALRMGGTKPPGVETLFEMGSISKAFTGILLARSIETGELHLDDCIADLLPEGWVLPEPAQAITLRHCTTHTSGLPRLPANLLSFSGNLQVVLLGSDPYRNYSEDQFREALATVKLNHEPGTRQEYSNFGTGLLGFVLARSKGWNYESLMIDKICRPLGMHHTVITVDEKICRSLPSKYRMCFRLGPLSFGLESDEWRIPNHLAGAGAIHSTGQDMLTFLKANMGRNSTPIDAAIRRSHQELFRDVAGMTIGMNWIRTFDQELSQHIIWHNGGTGGFRTYMGFTEDYRFGVFVLGNTANSVDSLAVEMLKSMASEKTDRDERPSPSRE